MVNTLAWVSRQKPNPFKHAVWGIGGVSDGKYGTIFSLSHLREFAEQGRRLVVPTLSASAVARGLRRRGTPNEPGIQSKAGAGGRELTHFSRGGI